MEGLGLSKVRVEPVEDKVCVLCTDHTLVLIYVRTVNLKRDLRLFKS